MKSLEPRIKKLENRYPQEISPPRNVVIGVPPCAYRHIVGATVGDKFFKRVAGETVDEMMGRVVAAEADGLVTISLNSPCYDSGGSKCRDVAGSECLGLTQTASPV